MRPAASSEPATIIPRVLKTEPVPGYREIAHEIDASVTRTLDVGCGNLKIPGAVGIDMSPDTQADVVHDLNEFPWPLPDSEFEVIRLWSVLEHLDDTLAVTSEVHRVGRRAPSSSSSCRTSAAPTPSRIRRTGTSSRDGRWIT